MSTPLKGGRHNAQRANNRLPKMGKDSHGNWWVTDVMNDLLAILQQGPITKVKSDQVSYHHCLKVSGQ